MNCRTARTRLTEQLYDELVEHQREPLERHLETCPDCRQHGEALRAAHRWLGILPDGDQDTSADVASIQRRHWLRTSDQARRWRQVACASLAVMACALAAFSLSGHIEFHRHQMVIGWGVPVVEQAVRPDFEKGLDDVHEQLEQLARRLEAVERLADLTAGELLVGDPLRADELARLWHEISRLESMMWLATRLESRESHDWEQLAMELLEQNLWDDGGDR